jgi:hypothetical protein
MFNVGRAVRVGENAALRLRSPPEPVFLERVRGLADAAAISVDAGRLLRGQLMASGYAQAASG